MATKTLAQIVTAVRAEAGHALSASQGLNALETIKYLIQRTQEELWTAFNWPELTIRRDLVASIGQYLYTYPADLPYEQVREVFFAPNNSTRWSKMEFGVGEDGIKGDGSNTLDGPEGQVWDVHSTTQFRIWPTPTVAGQIRMKGQKPIGSFVNDSDMSTIDGTLLAMLVSAEMLARAKSADAEVKQQKAQRHLQKLLGDRISAKQKVSTIGAARPNVSGLRPGIDYIP